jgi:2-iminoacetate synthase ThiH
VCHPEAHALAACDDLAALMRAAACLRDEGFGDRVTYSRLRNFAATYAITAFLPPRRARGRMPI